MDDYIRDWSVNPFIELPLHLAALKHLEMDHAMQLPVDVYVLDRVYNTKLSSVRAPF